MTTIHIELPDEQAEVLKAKLSVQGLSVEEWFRKLIDENAPRQTADSVRDAVARILELQTHVKPDPEGWTVKDYIHHSR